MTLSELIEKAQVALKHHGDIDVAIRQDSDEYQYTGASNTEAKILNTEDLGKYKFFCITDELG